MKLFSLLACIACLCILLWQPQSAQAQSMEVLYVTGGCCHDYEEQAEILATGLADRFDIEWTVDGVTETGGSYMSSRFQSPGWIDEFDLVIYNNCYAQVTDEEYIDGIVEAHAESGVGAVFLHCAMHTYRATESDSWNQLIGIDTYSHERQRESFVHPVNLDHPAMADFPEDGWEWPRDELYIVRRVSENMVPLAHAYGPDTENWHIMMWVNTYEGVRTVGTTMGHNSDVMDTPVYLDFVANGIDWILAGN